MISKNTFVQVMTRLEDLDKKMENVDVAMKALSPDFCGFYIPEAVGIALGIIKSIFKDKSDLISYLVFGLNWLHDAASYSVDIDNTIVDLSTWDKVYDFLIKNMEG